ncbi:hypothetical protein Tco_1555327 [Tanacetum coccineum]
MANTTRSSTQCTPVHRSSRDHREEPKDVYVPDYFDDHGSGDGCMCYADVVPERATKTWCCQVMIPDAHCDDVLKWEMMQVNAKQVTVLNTRVSKVKVNTVKVNVVNIAGQTAVSTVKGNGVTAVKPSGNPQQALKYKVLLPLVEVLEMVKIHTNNNVADLLTKAFDVSRFNFLVASIGRNTKIPQSGGPPIKVGDEAVHKELGTEWKGLPLLLLA